jgi:ComF family protein
MAEKYIDAVPFARSLAAAHSGARLRWPSLCAVCHGWGHQRVCGECLLRFARAVPRCARCAIAVPAGVAVCGACVSAPPPFASSVAAVDYAYPWDGLITRFKFHGALDLTAALTNCLADSVARSVATPPSLLLPVPLSGARLRERGYNQAWELTRRLGRLRRCAVDAQLLLRVRDTPHQLALPPEQRAGNMHAAFAVEPRRRAELQGRTVGLVDDVMTTGATAAEIARVLLQAGAAEVQVWAVARTPRPGEP